MYAARRSVRDDLDPNCVEVTVPSVSTFNLVPELGGERRLHAAAGLEVVPGIEQLRLVFGTIPHGLDGRAGRAFHTGDMAAMMSAAVMAPAAFAPKAGKA